jgi:hypothetical protein
MKPLPGDHRHRLLITGDELRKLKRHTGAMAEAFGLDRKIHNYKGRRPITLSRWDLECLMDVIDQALKDKRDYPDRSSSAYLALKSLGGRLRHEQDNVYGHQESPPALVSKKATGRMLKKPSPGSAGRSDDKVYQLKVALLDTRHPIWRRIQVKDCTLDKLHEPSIPASARLAYDAIVALTDAFCRDHLNGEYQALCRRLAGVLARKRPSPLFRGKRETWAGAIVRVVGWVNYLDDSSQTPHLKLTEIDREFGVSSATGQAKSKQIRDLLKIRPFDPEWALPSRAGDTPSAWIIQAYRKGLPPNIRGDLPS